MAFPRKLQAHSYSCRLLRIGQRSDPNDDPAYWQATLKANTLTSIELRKNVECRDSNVGAGA